MPTGGLLQTARILCAGCTDAEFRDLAGALHTAGHADVVHGNVDRALECIAARSLEALVLDLRLPSPDIVRVLQAAVPGGSRLRVPVLVATPPGFEDRAQSCLQHGADDVLSLPFDASRPMLLARRVRLALERRALREETVRLQTGAVRSEDTASLDVQAQATTRFVPREFLDLLQRKSLGDVRLGDHVEREMTVLFTDIRDFTALSESLTPQQNFDFLNSYLRHVTPIIRAHEGFVDKYIGDAIMALFPRASGDALGAAVELQKRVEAYNQGRSRAGYTPIEIGIGVHRGTLILGTIGEERRMQTTVISDAVNVASRIEGMTKIFGSRLLASGTVVDGLTAEQRAAHRLRHLGAVKAKGKTRNVEIFECYDNDSPEIALLKDETAQAFAAAVTEFRKAMFLSAGRIFARVAEINPRDTVAAYYRDRCSLTVVHERRGTHWDGAEPLEAK